MRVLSIGMDRKLFEEGSPVLLRSAEYASKLEELHIIVFSLKKHNLSDKKINNLYIYPTNSNDRISFLLDAYNLGKKIITENSFVNRESVITTQDPMTIVGFFLSKKFKFPLQLQIHTDIFNPYFQKSGINLKNFWYSNPVQKLFSDWFIGRVDGIRVVSEEVKQSILSRHPNLKASIDVLPIFIDTEYLANTYPARDIKKDFPQFSHIILMASRLSPEKRIDLAMEVFKKIINKFPLAGLVICGEGPEEVKLRKLIKQLGLYDKVMILPWQKDLLSYYKTADIFLLTSEFEGYGMTIIEAGSAGSPMVVTKVGIAKSNLFQNGENCFVCPVNDSACLSDRVVELIGDNTKKDLFKRKMQDSIKSVSKTKDEYVKEYVLLLEKLAK